LEEVNCMTRALVIIDMLNDFIHPDGSLYCGPAAASIVPAVERLLQEARSSGEPVIYLCDRHRPDDPEFEMFPSHCVAGSWGAQIIEELQPQRGEHIIPKRRYSGFFGTDLDLRLRELGATELRLVGVCTNICVLYTACDARMRHYRVAVVKDAVASFDAEAHRWALREMDKTLGVKLE